MIERKIAKIFQNGGSQAVRLPAEFRFDADEVYISRDEVTGDVVLEAVPAQSSLVNFITYQNDHPVTGKAWKPYSKAVAEIRMGRDEIRIEEMMDILMGDDE